jgi:hypothetical protein
MHYPSEPGFAPLVQNTFFMPTWTARWVSLSPHLAQLPASDSQAELVEPCKTL